MPPHSNPLFLLKYYHHFLLHLLTKSLNSCMPLLINNVTSTLSHLPPETSFCNYSFYDNNHSQSFPIYRYFPMHFNRSSCYSTPQKPTLDKDILKNYRPILNLSLVSKITERVVKSRLNEHLWSNFLYNRNQSAYIKYHCTENTILSLYDHLITAISHQQVSCFCLVDLPAAFDTIDHSIFLHRLSSWFGIAVSALTWFKTYLTSCSFSVLASGFASPPYPVSCVVPQGFVLGPIHFNMYTILLSALISSWSLHHHLYANDIQIFILFAPKIFTNAITQLQDKISDIASWMTANLLSLNPSKTEFMLIGLPQQISKISNPSISLPSNHHITPTDSVDKQSSRLDWNYNIF